MAATLTISIPESALQRLQARAVLEGKTAEIIAAEELDLHFRDENALVNPVTRWFGSIDSECTDLSERTDDYLGQSLTETHDVR